MDNTLQMMDNSLQSYCYDYIETSNFTNGQNANESIYNLCCKYVFTDIDYMTERELETLITYFKLPQ
jgi:hypothetical protein